MSPTLKGALSVLVNANDALTTGAQIRVAWYDPASHNFGTADRLYVAGETGSTMPTNVSGQMAS